MNKYYKQVSFFLAFTATASAGWAEHNPYDAIIVAAAATVIAAFPIFAGGGSLFSAPLRQQFMAEHRAGGLPVAAAAGGIATVAVTIMILLPHLSPRPLTLPDVCMVLVCVAVIAPLAFCMGMPFPPGLAGARQTILSSFPGHGG